MWLSVSLQSDARRVEALSEALMTAGALSVSVEDANAGTAAETPQFGEPGQEETAGFWANSRIVALFAPDTAVTDLVAEAAVAAGFDTVPAFDTAKVAEENWVQLTQRQFTPIRINDGLWIVPSWHEPPDASAINIQLDPGMAFGTGSHPTTRLCLEWLYESVRPGCSVLDYGCGSGILGIAAARLGAGAVLGVDIDEHALVSTLDNASRNGVAGIVKAQHCGKPLGAAFEVVVANILTTPLCLLAPVIAPRIADGGQMALSGVLEQQAGQVIDTWAHWITLEIGDSREGWIRLQGHR
ncbi:MAG: 50S ribosomal protein L11 methyltransferase [Azoarcus sp.]|jgi:ribosomal protein L11 methyltransferase|nr:50S ribosomal protein L11 methyltransferase [Azoarcus sp.]